MITRRSAGLAMLGLGVSCPTTAAANVLTDEERRQGWRLLFDGKTAEGWQEIGGKPFPEESWRIENGSLKTFVGSGGRQDISTVESFRSFDLQFDWMLPARGNSGVKYLIQRVDEGINDDGRQARARGLEYQLADGTRPEIIEDSRRAAASLYSVIAPSPLMAPKMGSFNHSRLLLDGDRVEHWLNGVRLVKFMLSDDEVQDRLRTLRRIEENPGTAILRDSPISLQSHSSEAWFRNIKIRRLD
jgi:hypothetical protein